MCWCRPEMRTPFCGAPNCHPPGVSKAPDASERLPLPPPVWFDTPPGPRTFVLRRLKDVSGVSGEGDVAHGVVFPDGTVAMRWATKKRSTCFYDSLDDVTYLHGHDGYTQVVWLGSFGRGFVDAIQDRCENVPFASVGGDHGRAAMRPIHPQHEPSEYLYGYCEAAKAMYGSDWASGDGRRGHGA